MLSVATKLHMLLLCTIIAVGLYMYFLYKELRMFQSEMSIMKKQLQGLLTMKPPSEEIVNVCLPTSTPTPVIASPSTTEPKMVHTNEDDEDDMSVTSNEIKDILTNIQEVDDIEEDEPATTVQLEDDIIMMEKKPWPDYASMSDEEIAKVKYDDLRNFLRSQGVHMKGSKQELINKIKEVVAENKNLSV